MADTSPTAITGIELGRSALQKGERKRVRKALRSMHPAKIAGLLESSQPAERVALWQQVDEKVEAEVLAHVSEELRDSLLQDAENAEVCSEQDPGAPTELERFRAALAREKYKRVRRMLEAIHPAKVAGLLESLPPGERSAAWEMVDSEWAGDVLVHLHDKVRARLALEMEHEDLVTAARGLERDDLVDLIQDLPEKTGLELLQAMDRREREQLESLLVYPENSAGGLMNTDHIGVGADEQIGSVLRYLRLLEDLPDNTDKVMVVDQTNRYVGVLRLRHLLTSAPGQPVREAMESTFPAIPLAMSNREVARRFQDLDLVSAPVVDTDGELLGRITVDDVVDVIRDELEHDMMNMAGLDEEEDIFAPVITSSRRRTVWLAANLVTAFLAAWVIGLFEHTIQQVVALAVLMPIVASMGGIAGSQTLTLMIRGMALGHIERGNASVLLWKELGIGALNGLIWALVVALLAVIWFGNWDIGGIIAAAMLLNLVCAAAAGVAIPLVLRKVGVDPALAGGVILTTVTDVVGFFAFLGLATLVLL